MKYKDKTNLTVHHLAQKVSENPNQNTQNQDNIHLNLLYVQG